MVWFLKDNSEQITQLKLERDALKGEVLRLNQELDEYKNQSSSSEEYQASLSEMEALIKFENEHMKSGILGIQANLANSVEGGKEHWKVSNHYQALETPHAAVHNGTKQIFELIKEENIDCNKIMQAVQLMEDASKEVFESLSEIAQDVKRRVH